MNQEKNSSLENIKDITSKFQQESKEKQNIINKRIDFNKQTLKKIELMLPVYNENLGEKISNSEALSNIINKAIDFLFEADFKKRIQDM